MSTTTSSLSSTANRSIRHLRWSEVSDGWGGDAEVQLAELPSLGGRLEWVEGEGDRWTLWIFDEDAYPEPDDIFLVSELGLALKAERVQTNTDLKGRFHHYEIRNDEHSMSVAELVALIP